MSNMLTAVVEVFDFVCLHANYHTAYSIVYDDVTIRIAGSLCGESTAVTGVFPAQKISYG